MKTASQKLEIALVASVITIFLLLAFTGFAIAREDENSVPGVPELRKRINETVIKETNERIKERMERVRERIVDIESAKLELRKCKENESVECIAVREATLAFVKTRFSENVERTIEKLKEVETRIQANERMSEEEKARISNLIGIQVERLQALKEKVPGKSSQELREAIKIYREFNKALKELTIVEVQGIKLVRIGLIIQRAEALEKKLERFLEKRNISANFSEDIEKIKNEIALAKANKEQAMQMWNALKEKIRSKEINASEIRQQVRAIHEKIEIAKTHLKESTKTLKEVIHELKELRIKPEEKPEEKEQEQVEEKSEAEAEENQGESGESGEGREEGGSRENVEAGSENEGGVVESQEESGS